MPQAIGEVGWRQTKPVPAKKETRKRAASAPTGSPAVVWLTYFLVAFYALTFASLSLREHDAFRTNAFDLGNMDQAIWNTANGRWFEFSNWGGGTSRLAAHVEPILILLAQIYRLHSDPRTLLILQSVVISLGALPVFWLARQKLRNDFAGLTFVAAYLLAPELEAANLADFHPVALSASFLLFAFYFASRRSYALFGLFAVLAMSTKEEIPLTIFLMGIYIALIQKDRLVGIATASIALAWFGLAFFVVIPANNTKGASPYLGRYEYLGESPRDILRGLISHPDRILPTLLMPQKVEYLRSLFLPVLFLSILSPLTAAFALPDLGINLLSTFPAMYTGGSHYSSAIIPLVVISAIFGLANLAGLSSRVNERLGQILVYLVCALVLIFSVNSYYYYFLRPLMDHFPEPTAHHQLAEKIAASIPTNAGVAASSALNPHVSQRRRLSLFPEIANADYVYVDVTSTPYPIDDANLYYRLTNMLKEGSWGVVTAKDGYLLLKRGLDNPRLPAEFYTFAKTTAPQIDQKLNVTFGDLTLLGYNLEPEGNLHGTDPHASLTLFWRAQRAIGRDYLMSISVVGVDGKVVDLQGFQPATLWYPTSRWSVDETIRVDVRRIPLQGRTRTSVYLGVVEGRDFEDPAKRLRPRVEGTGGPDYSADGTLLRLFSLRKG